MRRPAGGREEAVRGAADTPERCPELAVDGARGRVEVEFSLGDLEDVLPRQLELVGVVGGRYVDVELNCWVDGREGRGRGRGRKRRGNHPEDVKCFTNRSYVSHSTVGVKMLLGPK